MRFLVLSSALAFVAACNGGGDAPADADEALACMTSGRGDTYVVGLEHPGVGGLLDFKLMSADPAPPGRNLNTWVIQVNSMSSGVVGAPAAGASMIVTPFMPDHQHGAGAYKVQVEAMSDPGQYKLTEINTWMPGYWEITIDAQVGAVHDSVIYKFCIQA
jgi:YtkA-like